MRLQPDQIDIKILKLMQEGARQSVAQLADQVGLSVPACYKRINKLRSSKIIEREVAVVDPSVFGWDLELTVLVSLERERGNVSYAVLNELKNNPQILNVSYVTGEYGLIFTMVTQTMEDYEEFTRNVLYTDRNVKNFKTLVRMRKLK